ncbi:DUF2779 domain-containing protein [Candidatus Thiodiazotropha sp. LNASS1]|uniref:DUF2779 domain-containing protein n=1 Tax=Candidatus Thiodiazotropha sp. LNASS1 TaxID=3096260 RepID=UPI0034DE1413
MQKLLREGYEVERYVKQFFDSAGDRNVSFQAEFRTDDGLYARVDALESMGNGATALYEIKSSTSVKTDAKHNHIKDACFQKICAERAGQHIDRVFLVHLNGDYVRNGAIEPGAMLVFADITEAVEEVVPSTSKEIDAALAFLASEQNMSGCSCVEKTRANHCDAFAIFNPEVPTPSIYSLPRLRANKIDDLRSMNVLGLDDVPDDFPLSENQRIVVDSFQEGEPKVSVQPIRQFLSELIFPLYFFDYETFSSAVPLLDRTSPHKHFPVQYSLHILDADGLLHHKEYLEREARLPDRLLDRMKEDIGPEGSLVSWHASFEKTQSRQMAALFPDEADFLNDLNDRMVDLEDLFKTAYVDARFDGSTSIKKVLQVVCPHLDYSDLDVQDGASAMESWKRMLDAAPEEVDGIAQSLLRYCERDTFAMVEIYHFLMELIS